MAYKLIGGLSIDEDLHDFVIYEVLAGTGVGAQQLWTGLAKLFTEFGPKFAAVLAKREVFQAKIDDYFGARAGIAFDPKAFEAFLREIAYIEPAPEPFTISTAKVDPVLSSIAAPQFLAPASNVRVLLKAVNGRWGSLYDALYASDLIPGDQGRQRGSVYNKARGEAVIAQAKAFLDEIVPLAEGGHVFASAYAVEAGELIVSLRDGAKTRLRDPSQFIGFQKQSHRPGALWLQHRGLHIEIGFDKYHAVGSEDPAGIYDIKLESGVSTMVDFEDGAACVDVADRIAAYRNWLGLMKQNLRTQFLKNGKHTDRMLEEDRRCNGPKGEPIVLPGRGILLARIAGPGLLTDAILDEAQKPVPASLVDAAVVALIGLLDVKRPKEPKNSPQGSIYLIVPKLHGAEETALMAAGFSRIEDVLGIRRNGLKFGLINENPRLNLNLAASLKAVSQRVMFAATDFPSYASHMVRAGLEAGPAIPPGEMTDASFAKDYVANHLQTLFASGFKGRGQMVESSAQSLEGVNATLVRSPMAAVLRAMDYHRSPAPDLPQTPAAPIHPFSLPLAGENPGHDKIERELASFCRVILDVTSAFVDFGAALSGEANLSTLRLARQLIMNWLRHNLTTEDEVKSALQKAAVELDDENQGAADYKPFGPSFDGEAYVAAQELIFAADLPLDREIETILFPGRRAAKAKQNLASTNRYESLKGAAAGLEKGESFGRAD